MSDPIPDRPASHRILHVSSRETLRPIRDQVLRVAGYEVVSAETSAEALTLFHARVFDLVLIDVQNEAAVGVAERLCAEVRTTHPGQHVGFVCNWRVALLTDCPDAILRTEFDPEAFVAGVRAMLQPAS